MLKTIYTILLCCLCYTLSLGQMAIDTTYTAEDIIRTILIGNDDIKIGNINYRGSKRSIGVFEVDSASFALPKGLILSNGEATSAVGPNSTSNHSDQLNYYGDKSLSKITKRPTYDAAVLEFDFIPLNNRISFNYIFASEEYPEFVGSAYNDVFTFHINGPGIDSIQNLAILPNTNDVVAINSVNKYKNKAYYVDNNIWGLNGKKMPARKTDHINPILLQTLEYDGLTTVLTATTNVIPYQKYHLKIAISDVTDMVYNSAVFLEGGSFTAELDTLADAQFMVATPVDIDKIDFDAMFEKDLTPVIAASTNTKTVSPTKPKTKKNKPLENTVASTPKPIITVKAATSTTKTVDFLHLNPILFETNLYIINKEEELNKIVEMLTTNNKFHAYLYGHTDANGSDNANLTLSKNRAKEVEKYLLTKGIAKERIHIYYYGEKQPIADNTTETGKAMNRRVEVFLRPPF